MDITINLTPEEAMLAGLIINGISNRSDKMLQIAGTAGTNILKTVAVSFIAHAKSEDALLDYAFDAKPVNTSKDILLENTDLNGRTKNALIVAGIKTLQELAKYNSGQLLRIPRISKLGLVAIEDVLKQYKLK